jgi:hypothetical protein
MKICGATEPFQREKQKCAKVEESRGTHGQRRNPGLLLDKFRLFGLNLILRYRTYSNVLQSMLLLGTPEARLGTRCSGHETQGSRGIATAHLRPGAGVEDLWFR